MFDDHYDIFCFQRLGELAPVDEDPYEADNVVCACAEYLHMADHKALSDILLAKRVMSSAVQLIPTTTNINNGDIL